MERQPVESQRAEILFRQKLYQQQVESQNVISDEFDGTAIQAILQERMKSTFDQMQRLSEQNIKLFPYLEIGAERCQRSLVMENDFGAQEGAAADISFDMLRSCDHYRNTFKKHKSPFRVCCDANHLPFLTGSFPFVFCFETLHHFPNPEPITREIYRVMAPGGAFFFSEEPYKQVLHFNLYQTPKMYSTRTIQRSKIKKTLDYFFASRTCNEVDFGVIENDNISLNTWRKALSFFDSKTVTLSSVHKTQADLFQPASLISNTIAYLMGGSVSGLCRKKGETTSRPASLTLSLACPTCRSVGNDAPLATIDAGFSCQICSRRYPKIEEVCFLLPYDKFEELYPDIFRSFQKS